MNPLERAREIFSEAVARPEDERSAFVARRCADDPELLDLVLELLRADAARDDRSEAATEDSGNETAAAWPPAGEVRVLETVGPYRIIEQIGEGGFGVVYRAERPPPLKQQVALKLLRPEMESRSVVARFESERQILAMMDHPSIARVFDAGMSDLGLPYFVMEYVRGEPITTYCDRQRLSIPDRLNLFADVCDAVQHAHSKGIIHRDIKPSNILVTIEGSRPVPKVIDFGVAKALSQPLMSRDAFTRIGQLIGTPEYMSPEQAEGSQVDIDTRSDVYSLGVVLYELLTGVVPFDPETLRSAAFKEIQRIIREVDPPKPSMKLSTARDRALEAAERRRTKLEALTGDLRRELEWIPLKALRKDRVERYRSAADLADDVRRYLDGKPLTAGPETLAYQARKFAKRNRTLVVSAASVAAAVILGLVTTSAMYAVARTQRIRADRAAEQERLLSEQLTESTQSLASVVESLNTSGPDAPRLPVPVRLRLQESLIGVLEQLTEFKRATPMDVAEAYVAAGHLTLAAINHDHAGESALIQQPDQTAVGAAEKLFETAIDLAERQLDDADQAAVITAGRRGLANARLADADPARALQIARESIQASGGRPHDRVAIAATGVLAAAELGERDEGRLLIAATISGLRSLDLTEAKDATAAASFYSAWSLFALLGEDYKEAAEHSATAAEILGPIANADIDVLITSLRTRATALDRQFSRLTQGRVVSSEPIDRSAVEPLLLGYQTLRADLEQLADELGDDPPLLELLTQSYAQNAAVLTTGGDPSTAVSLLQSVLPRLEQSARADPLSIRRQLTLAIALKRLGESARYAKKPEIAVDSLGAARDLYERAASASPENSLHALRLMQTLTQLEFALRQNGTRSERIDRLIEVGDAFDRLARHTDPEPYLRDIASRAVRNAGSLTGMDDTRAELRLLERALAIHPSDRRPRVLELHAKAHAKLGEFERAIAYATEAISRLERSGDTLSDADRDRLRRLQDALSAYEQDRLPGE